MTSRFKNVYGDTGALFENCISLGWFCGTALSMVECGLRSYSGPFDWCFSDLKSVLYMIENDFKDFMLKENLEVSKDDPKVFCDFKYGFYCNHDISISFEKEYSDIFKKYQKRSNRFIELTEKPTCFIRAVRSEEEVLYINQNIEYIYSVIKKRNLSNEIIFILTKNMTQLSDELLWFRIEDDNYVGQIYEMRTMFKSSKKLMDFCKNNILSEDKIKNNIEYEKQKLSKEDKNALVINRIQENNTCIIEAVERAFQSIYNEGIYIWGGGEYGIKILKYLKDNKVKTNAIIDNNEEKIGTCINGVVVVSLIDVPDNANIFVAVGSEVAEKEIVNQISACKECMRILTFNELYGYLNIPELLWF